METLNEKKRAREFFASANGGEGFFSYYGEIFSPEHLERRYLIKGGAGSGKSSLIRRVADLAEKKGIEVERYLCSSDHTSLDGAIIGGRVALIDSTAPHILECEHAGVVDEIADTGRFWNSEVLGRSRERISELSKEKKRYYDGAYGALGAALLLARRQRALMLSYLDMHKISKAAERILSSVPEGRGYSRGIGLCESIGMKGRCRLDSYNKLADKLYIVRDYLSTADLFLGALFEEAKRKKCRIRVSYSPLDRTRIDALLLEESGIGFVIGRGEEAGREGRVNMRRFIDFSRGRSETVARDKSEFRELERLKNSLSERACKNLEEAGRAHFALEKIYGEAMDFEALDGYCEAVSEKIIKRFTFL